MSLSPLKDVFSGYWLFGWAFLKQCFGTLHILPYCLLAPNSSGKTSADNIIEKNCTSIFSLFSSRISFWILCMFSVFLLIFIFCIHILPFSHSPCLLLAVWACIKLFKNLCLVDLPPDFFRNSYYGPFVGTVIEGSLFIYLWIGYNSLSHFIPFNLLLVINYSFKCSSVIILETRLSSFPRVCWGFFLFCFVFDYCKLAELKITDV